MPDTEIQLRFDASKAGVNNRVRKGLNSRDFLFQDIGYAQVMVTLIVVRLLNITLILFKLV